MKDYTLIAVGFVLFLAVFVNLPSDFEVAKAEAESVEYMTDQWLSDSIRAEHPDWTKDQVEDSLFREGFDTNSDLANAMLKDNE